MTVNYELVEAKSGYHEDHWAIKLLEGDYEGVTYQYDTVAFEEENGQTILKFNTITVENPNEKDLTSESFKDTIGDILVEIIEEQLREENNGNGKSDTEEPTE
jgi:hypothetical protein